MDFAMIVFWVLLKHFYEQKKGFCLAVFRVLVLLPDCVLDCFLGAHSRGDYARLQKDTTDLVFLAIFGVLVLFKKILPDCLWGAGSI